MNIIDRLEWDILNATADDWENLEQIHQLIVAAARSSVNGNGAPAQLKSVADRIRRLVEAGLLEIRCDGTPADTTDLSYVWRAWFAMSPAGRTAWEQSEYAKTAAHAV